MLSRCDGQVLGVDSIHFIEAFAASNESQQCTPYPEMDSFRQCGPCDVWKDKEFSRSFSWVGIGVEDVVDVGMDLVERGEQCIAGRFVCGAYKQHMVDGFTMGIV